MGSHKPSELFIADFETNCIRCISSLGTCQVGNNKRKCERERVRHHGKRVQENTKRASKSAESRLLLNLIISQPRCL